MISKIEFIHLNSNSLVEDKTDQQVNYLDLPLEIKSNSLSYRLFDKRDNFGFSIVNFPNLHGNIPTNQSYGIFISQLVRYSRCCQQFVDFRDRAFLLVKKLIKQHFKWNKLCRTFNKFASRYPHLLKKYKEFRIYDLSILDFKSNPEFAEGGALKHSPWYLNLL